MWENNCNTYFMAKFSTKTNLNFLKKSLVLNQMKVLHFTTRVGAFEVS